MKTAQKKLVARFQPGDTIDLREFSARGKSPVHRDRNLIACPKCGQTGEEQAHRTSKSGAKSFDVYHKMHWSIGLGILEHCTCECPPDCKDMAHAWWEKYNADEAAKAARIAARKRLEAAAPDMLQVLGNVAGWLASGAPGGVLKADIMAQVHEVITQAKETA